MQNNMFATILHNNMKTDIAICLQIHHI